MPLSDPSSLLAGVRSITAALRTVPIPDHTDPFAPPPPPVPFVTISRQAGAGGISLAENLMKRLNQRDQLEHPWTTWDKELVEKAAEDHHVSKQLIESLEDKGRSWFEDFLGGLGHVQMSDLAVYRRVAATIRALAGAGHVIIVGRGGMFITGKMPAGIHIRLIAPLESRIARMMTEVKMTHDQASTWVIETDKKRDAFYRRFWPDKVVSPDAFTATLNTGSITDEALTECILPLIPSVGTVPHTHHAVLRSEEFPTVSS